MSTIEQIADTPPPRLAPVTLKERISSVDTLRGFALLGILPMNIIAFALPGVAYLNPALPALAPYQGPFTGANLTSWWVMHVIFDQKMMSIFSMLFGAGLVLMGGRAGGRAGDGMEIGKRQPFAGVYYRRLFWLFIIGMIHAHLIWFGDILVAYALCGLVLYPFRNLRPQWLLAIGIALVFVAVPIMTLMGISLEFFSQEVARVQELVANGQTIRPDQQEMLKGYHEMMKGIAPTPEDLQQHVTTMRGSYPEVVALNSHEALSFQTMFFFIWTFWRAAGLMFVGMALMKLGVFAAARSTRTYAAMVLAGYAIGLPLVINGAVLLNRHGFDAAKTFTIDGHFNYIGSLGVAVGHIGLVMLICKSGAFSALRRCLAAVGQMAFTNYLMQSILMTSIFFGWGMGYFGTIERAPLYLFVLGVWILQLIISPLWLSRFRFGPAEWVWRSLTYWKAQPMRR